LAHFALVGKTVFFDVQGVENLARPHADILLAARVFSARALRPAAD
jgi:hypothetical protein